MSRFISLTKLCSAASFTRATHYSILSFTYVEDYGFSIAQRKTSWIYLEIAAFQDFKVSLPLPHPATRLRAFRQSLSRPKGKKKKNNNNCKFEFQLNCKQRLMFHKGPISDNKVYVCRCCSVLFM